MFLDEIAEMPLALQAKMLRFLETRRYMRVGGAKKIEADVRLVLATHPGGEYAAEATTRYIRCGASPRAAQAVVLASKVRALLEGRYNVSFEDVRSVYLPALRHRVLLNFEAQAENIAPDVILTQVLEAVKEKT